MRAFGIVVLGTAALTAVACRPDKETPRAAGTTAAVVQAGNPIEMVAVRRVIMQANARTARALERGDVAEAASSYADDALVMMPNEPVWRGRSEIARGLQRQLASARVTDAEYRTTDVLVAGDLAIETATYRMTLRSKDGKESTDRGKYLTVWRHQSDGSWKIVRDINNSDLASR